METRCRVVVHTAVNPTLATSITSSIDLVAARMRVLHIRASTPPLVAIEAYWRCCSDGLSVALVAIITQPSWRHPCYSQLDITTVLPNALDPRAPWPQAYVAAEVGEQLSRELGIPFYFTSRDQPRDEVVRWWDRGRGQPCDDCGLEIRQNPAVHWFGTCYPCHVAREDRQPRVHIELVRDVDHTTYERVSALVDASLHAAGAGGTTPARACLAASPSPS
jgi:hypothetical protein